MISYSFLPTNALIEIHTLSLHDALPICTCSTHVRRHDRRSARSGSGDRLRPVAPRLAPCDRHVMDLVGPVGDRKSTRLNSSHTVNSYAVFCLKKKNNLRERSTARLYNSV